MNLNLKLKNVTENDEENEEKEIQKIFSIIDSKIDNYFLKEDNAHDGSYHYEHENNLYLIFDIDKIDNEYGLYVSDLHKTPLYRGFEIINKLVLLCKDCNLKFITIDDDSFIIWNDYRLSLGHLKILTTGMSYYNSLGFKQKNYEYDIQNWNIYINSNFLETLNSLNQMEYLFDNYKKYKDILYYDGIKHMNEYICKLRACKNITITNLNFKSLIESYITLINNNLDELFINILELKSKTIKDIILYIEVIIKNNEIIDTLKQNIYILIITLFSLPYEYNRKSLLMLM